MIRVRKREEAPKELATRGYSDDAVKHAILEDQDDKCYICERKVTTDYQVEHLVSQKNDEGGVNEWGNLYIACNYCNNKKRTSFDDIKHPDKYNVEDVIRHSVDLENERVIFSSAIDDPKIKQTVNLLERMFNGTNAPKRVLNETRFYNKFKQSYNNFQSVVHDYLAGNCEEMRPVIEKQIDLKSEYLAFKYAIIMENEILRRDFGELVRWNKQ